MPVEVVLGYVGNWGNVMLQLFIVERLQRILGPVRLAADDPRVVAQLRQLGRDLPVPIAPPEARHVARARVRSADDIATAFARADRPALEIRTCALRYVEWPALERARVLFPQPETTTLFAPDELVINIRGGNILRGIHRDYVVLPPSFYRHLIKTSGLRPVFFGQLGDDPYGRALREAFPKARFVPSNTPAEDFAQLRAARHLVLSISTFSLLAGWLSQAETIHLPLAGGFNPFQRPDGNSLPLDDPRFRFYQFPLLFMEPIETFLPGLEARAGGFVPVEPEAVRERLARWPLYRMPLEQGLSVLDPTYYAGAYADVSSQADQAGITAADHYRLRGHARHRFAARVDPFGYARAYPDAARAIGFGDFRNAYEHWVLVGRFVGYDPCPPAQVT